MKRITLLSICSLLLASLACQKVSEPLTPLPSPPVYQAQHNETVTPTPVQTVGPALSHAIMMVDDGSAINGSTTIYLFVRLCSTDSERGDPGRRCPVASSDLIRPPFYTNDSGLLYLAPATSTPVQGLFTDRYGAIWVVLPDFFVVMWCDGEVEWLKVSYDGSERLCPAKSPG